MYAIYLTAIPDASSEVYDTSKSYPIVFVVNTLSKSYAIEKAEKMLKINQWAKIDIQYIGPVTEDQKRQYIFDENDLAKDFSVLVFPHQAKNKYVQMFIHWLIRIKVRADRFIYSVRYKKTRHEKN